MTEGRPGSQWAWVTSNVLQRHRERGFCGSGERAVVLDTKCTLEKRGSNQQLCVCAALGRQVIRTEEVELFP